MRIKGLVAASNRVRQKLTSGLYPEEVTPLQMEVTQVIHRVEQLCAAARMSPLQLPLPSRKAYLYLKHLDIQRLPVTEVKNTVATSHQIAIRNLSSRQKQLHAEFAQLALLNPLSSEQITALLDQLKTIVQSIEQICTDAGLSPAHLSRVAQPIYGWLNFLLDTQNLEQHLLTVRRIQNLVLSSKLIEHHSLLTIELTVMTPLYRQRKNTQGIQLKLHEGFLAADDSVFDALAKTLRHGKQRNTSSALRQFSTSAPFIEITRSIEQWYQAKTHETQGVYHNLQTAFERVNSIYFAGQLQAPKLNWSQTFTHSKFGHYDSIRDQIMLSRSLDTLEVPEYVVDFIVYHELLHKVHGARWVNGQKRSHTSAFHRDEHKFKEFHLAKQRLEQLAQSLR